MVVVKDVPDVNSTMHGHIGYDIPEHEVNRCLKPIGRSSFLGPRSYLRTTRSNYIFKSNL